MKPFSFIILLNVLTLFAYAQNQKTCEQIQRKACTPCQQVLFKVTSAAFADPKKAPADKCQVFFIFFHYLLENTSVTPDNPIPEATKVKEALDKTCAETANNACSESTAKSVYTEIDKSCDAELKQYYPVKGTGKELTPPNNAGFLAEMTIATYYSAIPLRENMCVKVGGEYCFAKTFEQMKQSQSESPESVDPFSVLQCDECSKQTYSNLKSYQSSHPLDTPNLQKIMGGSNKTITDFENKCPDIANSFKSDGQKLSNQFYNYPGTILISILGFIYVTFMY